MPSEENSDLDKLHDQQLNAGVCMGWSDGRVYDDDPDTVNGNHAHVKLAIRLDLLWSVVRMLNPSLPLVKFARRSLGGVSALTGFFGKILLGFFLIMSN